MSIAIIGAGLIGQQWAMIFASKPNSVFLYDTSISQIELAISKIKQDLKMFQEENISRSSDDCVTQLNRIRFLNRFENIPKDVEFVLECVVEKLEIKRSVFKQIDAHFPEKTIRFSTSSYIPISKITEGLKSESNSIIAHPVNPPYFLKLVELCPSEKTSSNTVLKVKNLMENFGQKCILVKREVEGFCVNRIQSAVYNSIFKMLQDDIIDTKEVDVLLTEGLAPRWTFYGPIAVAELNGPGIDTYINKYGDSINRINEQQNYPPQIDENVKNKFSNAKQTVILRSNYTEEQLRNIKLGNVQHIKNKFE